MEEKRFYTEGNNETVYEPVQAPDTDYNDNFSAPEADPYQDVSSKSDTRQIELEQPVQHQTPVYSYQSYRSQFAVQESTAKPAVKKKKSGGGKTAMIACSLVLAMCLGFGGGILGSYLVGSNSGDKNITATSEGKVVTATTTKGNDSGLQIVESSSVKKSSGNSISDVVKNVKDSVVEITTESTSYNSFYGQYVMQGAGSGVIISADGYIVTNHHVIEDASDVKVTLTDGKSYKAEIIGSDDVIDIALIKIDASDLTVATLGSSSDLEVGETSIIIGNPLGKLGGSVTAGIVSALNRNITIDGQNMELLQTDAAINPGNSGGGMFDINGNLIGIVVAKSVQTSSGTTVESIGYAIPIDNVKAIIGDLKNNGRVTGRAYLGIKPINISDESTMRRYGVDKEGVYVYTVYDNTAASDAGFTVGDLILKFDGKEIKTSAELNAAILKKKAGDVVEVVISRDGEEKTLTVTLGEEEDSSKGSGKKNSNGFDPNGNGGSSGNGGSNGGRSFDNYDDLYDYFFNW